MTDSFFCVATKDMRRLMAMAAMISFIIGKPWFMRLLGACPPQIHLCHQGIRPVKVQEKTGLADQALEYIGKLYAIEKKSEEGWPDTMKLHQRRQANAVLVLTEFHAWLSKRLSEVPPKSLVGKTIPYTLGQWDPPQRHVDDRP